MKTKLVLFIQALLISFAAFSQDSTFSYQKNASPIHTPNIPKQSYKGVNQPAYFDTRLGSSSPLYNSYQKNLNGAGAVTNDSHKGQNGQIFGSSLPEINSTSNSTIYKDTRLGSSSPLYNTYQKNDFGAGAITSNPNKSGSNVQEFVPATSDTLKKQ